MALQPPLSAKHATTVEHHRARELRKRGAVAFGVLTFNSVLVAYLLWGDAEGVASVGLTYALLVVLFAGSFGCWEPPATDGGRRSRRLDAVVCFLSLSVAALLASRLARRTTPLSASALLVAAAGAAALAVGGCFAYLLHRRSWSKQQQQHQKIILPLIQESRG